MMMNVFYGDDEHFHFVFFLSLRKTILALDIEQ